MGIPSSRAMRGNYALHSWLVRSRSRVEPAPSGALPRLRFFLVSRWQVGRYVGGDATPLPNCLQGDCQADADSALTALSNNRRIILHRTIRGPSVPPDLQRPKPRQLRSIVSCSGRPCRQCNLHGLPCKYGNGARYLASWNSGGSSRVAKDHATVRVCGRRGIHFDRVIRWILCCERMSSMMLFC